MEIKKCDKCKITYEKNKKFNMINQDLGPEVKSGQAIGYLTHPIIDGIIISSTCGTGKKIDLCDNCICELLNFLNNSNDSSKESKNDDTKIINKEINNSYAKQKWNRIRRIRVK